MLNNIKRIAFAFAFAFMGNAYANACTVDYDEETGIWIISDGERALITNDHDAAMERFLEVC